MPPNAGLRPSRLALLLALSACAESREPAPTQRTSAAAPPKLERPPAPSTSSPLASGPQRGAFTLAADPAPIPERQGLRAWLRAGAVTDDDWARGVLYSWTGEDTLAQLRRDRRLFDDNELPEGPTPYVQRLQHVASQDDVDGRLARALLGHPDLKRRRYAWSRPWATRLGAVRPYGANLVAVRLAANAVVGRFDPAQTPAWQFRDLDQRPVPVARVLADPSRVAAILHVRSDAAPRYREYVLCNETAIAQWSVHTPQARAVIAEDAHRLRELALLPSATIDADYLASLAFDLDRYRPTPANLVAIARALETSPQTGGALTVRPRRAFRRTAAPEVVQVRMVPPRLELLI